MFSQEPRGCGPSGYPGACFSVWGDGTGSPGLGGSKCHIPSSGHQDTWKCWRPKALGVCRGKVGLFRPGSELGGWGVPCAVFCSLRSSESPRFKGTGQAAPLVCRGSQGPGRAVKRPWGHPPLRCRLSVVSPPEESRTSQVEGRPPREPLRPSPEPPSSGTQENFVLGSHHPGGWFLGSTGQVLARRICRKRQKREKG